MHKYQVTRFQMIAPGGRSDHFPESKIGLNDIIPNRFATTTPEQERTEIQRQLVLKRCRRTKARPGDKMATMLPVPLHFRKSKTRAGQLIMSSWNMNKCEATFARQGGVRAVPRNSMPAFALPHNDLQVFAHNICNMAPSASSPRSAAFWKDDGGRLTVFNLATHGRRSSGPERDPASYHRWGSLDAILRAGALGIVNGYGGFFAIAGLPR